MYYLFGIYVELMMLYRVLISIGIPFSFSSFIVYNDPILSAKRIEYA
jgi:hypothetical protein